MKIRTDFVTNSSSSSFIFKEYDQGKIKKAIEKRLSVPPKDEWEERSYEWVRESCIEGKRFKEHCTSNLWEVFSWYREEVICDILGIKYKKLYYNYKDEYEKNYFKVIEELEKQVYEAEKCKKLTALFIMDVYKHFFEYSREVVRISISYDFMKLHVWEYLDCWEQQDEITKEFYLENIGELMKHAREFDGKDLGDVMEVLFDAQYLYFDDLETDDLIFEALRNAGLGLYASGHMG